MNKIFYDMEDYKEKYEMGLEGLQEILSTGEDSVKMSILQLRLEGIFPELKESEDEKIRKVLIDYFDRANKVDENPLIQYGIHTDKILAWLEKQGEHKPVDKVEPKFHEGEWVTDKQGIVHQIFNVIENVTNHTYTYDIVGGGYFNDNTEGVRLWSINDAKDGDVLASDNGVIILVKESRDSSFGYRLSYHCAILYDGTFEPKEFHVNPEKFFPATKEQRNTLFVKMKEAGYEWDAEKKELKKIDDEEYNGEDYGIDSLFHAQRILEKTLGKVDGYQSDDGILSHKCAITAVKKLYKQKLAWSDEAEEMLDNAIFACISTYGKDSDSAVWLKSLKQRIGE